MHLWGGAVVVPFMGVRSSAAFAALASPWRALLPLAKEPGATVRQQAATGALNHVGQTLSRAHARK